MRHNLVRALLLASLLAGFGAGESRAQDRPREPRGFDFSPNGVWRRKARAVMQARAAALARHDAAALTGALRAPAAARLACAPGVVVCGQLKVPVLLVRYRNTDTTALHTPAEYNSALFDSVAPAGSAFTVRTFYEQMSNGVFSMRGLALPWAALDSNDTFYEGASGCNGIFCGSSNVPRILLEAVQKNDAAIDFGQFDNDGDDGVPNSGDDDGFVDLAVYVQPELDGACGGNNNIWSHRFSYAGWTGGATIPTNDPSAKLGFGTIRINDYTIQSGVGGQGGCSQPTGIMPIGTIAHETGHAFGIPDLYDTNPNDSDNGEGIGHWGLMSSGNYARPWSPAHMEGFSRALLGWVTVRPLPASGSYSLGAYPVADTVFQLVPPTSINTRGEYYLLENRQPALGDTALINTPGAIGVPKGPGLLVWHVDPVQYNTGIFSNTVNSGPIHALALEQADGLNQLGSGITNVRNRGDAGDPFPGSQGRTSFGFNTTPAAYLNTGSFSGVVIDSIRQVVAGGEMAFRLRYLQPVYFAPSGNGNIAATPGVASGTLLPVGDSVVLNATPAAGLILVRWTGDTTTTSSRLVLHVTRPWAVAAEFAAQLAVQDTVLHDAIMGALYSDTIRMSGGNGTFGDTLIGGVLPPGLSMSNDGQFSGVATTAGTYSFTVRVTSGGQALNLPLRINVVEPALVVTNVVNQLLGQGAPLSGNELRYLDFLGNQNNTFDVGDFVAWLDHTGASISAATMARVLAGAKR